MGVATRLRERVENMTETMQKVTRFTESQMGTVIQAIAGHGEVAGVEATWAILLGHPLEMHEGQVNPSGYAIPVVQWHALCEAIIARERADATHTGMPGGTWMNVGPSSFTEVAEVIETPGTPQWYAEPEGQWDIPTS